MNVLGVPALLLLPVTQLPAQDMTKFLYTLSVDCDHPDHANEGTSSPITIAFLYADQFGSDKTYYAKTYNGIPRDQCTEFLGGVSSQGHFTFSLNLPLTTDAHAGDSLQRIRVTTSGNDAFLIDEIKLAETKYYYKTILGQWIQSGTSWNDVQQWGVNGGGAWCLSADPNDVNGEWRGSVADCFDSIVFDVKTGQAYGSHSAVTAAAPTSSGLTGGVDPGYVDRWSYPSPQLYVFSGDQYARYDIRASRFMGAAKISDGFPGLIQPR